MHLLSSIYPLYSLSGFGVGILVGLTGVGGGSLMTPLLVLLFGIGAPTAVGTDLLFASITKSAGTLVHGWNGTVDWRITALLAAGSVPASIVTLLVLAQFHSHDSVSRLLTTVLGVALILSALALMARRWIVQLSQKRAAARASGRTGVATIAVGAVLGVLVCLSSVGAGALGVSALIFLYPGRPLSRIVGSDIAHAVPLTLLAGLGHWLLGSVDWFLLSWLTLGSLPGIVLGSYFSGRVPDIVLRPMLAATLMLVGGRLAL